MVIGLPGSGKSFFARQFAEMFNAPLVSIDYIRNALFATTQYTADEDTLIGSLTSYEVAELMKTQKTFIIDGGLNNRAARLAVEKVAVKSGYGKLIIWIQTDEPTSLVRSTKRSPKRAGDALNVSMDPRAFERYKKQFNVPTISEDAIVISGKHTYATQARVVLKKLVAPREINTTSDVQRPLIKTEEDPDVQPRRRSVTIN